MKNATSPARRLLLSKNFILMIVMLVVIIVAVSAWFTLNRTVTADNISVTATSTQIQIAKVLEGGGPGEFSNYIKFDGPFVFNKDCTGDGENLIVPEFNVTKDFDAVRIKGGKEVNENQSGSAAIEFSQATEENPEYHYFQFQFFLRSTSPNVYLDETSVLLSSMEKNDGNDMFTPNQTAKKSDYGNYADGLVGAMRVSLLAQACNSVEQTWSSSNEGMVISNSTAKPNALERQLLWDPRPDVHLSIPETPGKITDWSLTRVSDFTYYSPVYYLNKTEGQGLNLVSDDPKLKVSNSLGTYKVSENKSLTIPYLNGPAPISTFTNNNGYNYNQEGHEAGNGTVKLAPDKEHTSGSDLLDYYVTKYTMNVWIEGTDNEARRAMDGGEFYLQLKFK